MESRPKATYKNQPNKKKGEEREKKKKEKAGEEEKDSIDAKRDSENQA